MYESEICDDSKNVLRLLGSNLKARGIRHRMILNETTHEDEINQRSASQGWHETPRGRNESRRIPCLSRLRNKTLDSLARSAANGTTFDKVLFLNDVAFTVLTPVPHAFNRQR